MTDRPITFAGNAPYPPLRNMWPRLAETAKDLLVQRQQGYPAEVRDGRMTEAEAQRGERIMKAVVAQWRLVVTGKPLPDIDDYPATLGATPEEMRAELARIAARAWHRAHAAPDDAKLADLARLTAALAWQQTPCAKGCAFPHIWQAADFARYEATIPRRGRRAA